ncbi:MAG: cation:proton antiporter [Proteobacteria bacterium]|nr:cation:proton antiporter [Pseudomonadota bacterium]
MHDVVLTLLGLSGLLLVTSCLPPLAERFNIPLTVLLALAGSVLGALALWSSGMEANKPGIAFLHALSQLGFSSEAFLYIFLPTLLFETALSIDVRRLVDDLAPILLLAVVAVLVSTAVVGGAIAMTSSYSLVACMLLGAIVSTTDPIAVVGIFRDLGAPRRLSVLVEGESLLNDAAAIALFTLLLAMLTGGHEPDLLAGVGDFVVKFLGGVLLGWTAAWATVWLFGWLRDISLAEITLTIALAYALFILAEQFADVSGVVAVVTGGIAVAVYGRTRLSPDNWDTLLASWRQLGFWANSLIFLIASTLVPRTLMAMHTGELWLLLVLAAAALFARALVLWGLLPILSWIGLAQRISHGFLLVILWGGLRGAVTLALALGVADHAGVPDEVKRFVALLATGFVLVTLFVNAPSLRWLIRLLGLDRLSPADQAMRDQAIRLSHASVREHVATAAEDNRIDPEAAAAVLTRYESRIAAITESRKRVAALSENERAYIGLLTLANREEELYLQRFRDRVVSREIVDGLLAEAGRLIDAVKGGAVAGYQKAALQALGFSRAFRLAVALHQHFTWSTPLARGLADRFEHLLIVRLAVDELKSFIRGRLAAALGDDIGQSLEAILEDRRDGVARALEAMRLQYPDYAKTLDARYLARAAQQREGDEYRALLAERVIGPEVYSALDSDLAQRRALVNRPLRLDLGISREVLVAKMPLFAPLTPDQRGQVARLLRPRLALPDERILERGGRGDAMFFISSGAVEVEIETGPAVRLGTGDFFGEVALLTHRPRNAGVRALGYCWLLTLQARDFQRFIAAHDGLAQHISRVAQERPGVAG